MRNLKKFLALVLATLMVVSAAATVSAYAVFDDVEDDNQYAEAIGKLVEYDITNGIGDGLFGVDNDVERYQMALFMARALNPNETDWQSGMAIFDDVEEWYGAIAYAYTKGIVTGIGNNLFAPHNGIRYQDALIMALRALGYTVDVSGDPYWLAAYTQAAELGLTDNVAVTKGDKVLSRAETAQVICNMLSAKPADGGATIEEKNFGVAGVNNVTTFVITATPNQAYADGAKANDKDYVGIQPLVNGIPNGNITYLPAEMLGITAAEADDYFNYSVDLVNYDEETGRFDNAVICGDPDVYYSTDVSVSGAKVTVGGKAYYPSAELTGAALKNEIVVYAGGADARESRILLKDADGDIINQNGVKQAIFAYTSPNGTKYYADRLNNKVISETVALATYGVIVEGSFTEYQTLTTGELGVNYQLTLFDDDANGFYDRAIYTPVYMSVYNNPDGNKVNITSDAFAANTEGVKFSEKLAKGDVFVYTYNKQLKKVNVIEKLAVETGKIENLNLTNYKEQSNANNWLATITISGKTYKIGNEAQEKYMGASLCETATAPAKFSEIAGNARIGYKNNSLSTENVIALAEIGSAVKYIAFNGYIIYAETYNIEASFDYMVVVDAVNYDANGVYVDAYVKGVRDTYLISQYTDAEGNTVAFADLSVFKLQNALNTFATACKKAVYKTIPLADGSYKVSQAFVDTDASRTSFKLYKAVVGTYAFNDGITDVDTSLTNGKEERIRTNANTKFYFVNTAANGTISLFTGKLADKYSITVSAANGTTIYADHIGYGENNSKYGVANIVVVYYNDVDTIEGFNLSSITNAIVYVPAPGTYTIDSAANFGLTGKSGTYCKYGSVAINMADGSTMAVYTTKNARLEAGKFYSVDGSGIATVLSDADLTAKIGTVELTKSNVDLADQYITVNGVCTVANKVTKMVTTPAGKLEIKNDKTHLSDTAKTVKFLKNDTADGIVVLVVCADVVTPPPTTDPTQVTIVTNAKYNSATGVKAANYAGSIVNGKASGKLTITSVAFTAWDAEVTGTKVSFVNTVGTTPVNYSLASVKVNGAAATVADYVFTATANADGQLEINLSSVRSVATDTGKLAAGNYVLTIQQDANSETYEISFIVD